MRIKLLIKYCILTFTMLAYQSSLFAAGIKVTQQGSGTYSPGQTFTVIVEAENVKGLNKIPNFSGCDVVGNSNSQFTSITAGAGGEPQLTTTIRQVLTLQARQPGKYTYGPITAAGSRSNTITYTISGNASANSAQTSSSSGAAPTPSFTQADRDQLMVKATVSNSSPYIQQPVIYTVRLYSRVPLYTYPEVEDPKMDNGIFEVMPSNGPHQVTETVINGVSYATFELYSLLVYPSKPGEVRINSGDVIANVPGYGRLGAKANEIILNVKELPEMDKHPDINGVGEFNVSSILTAKQVRAGEPAHFTITVKGFGNPSFISLPDIQPLLPEGMKFIKSESKVDKNVTAGNIDGTVTFDCIVMPSKEGDFSIPAIEFNFFNPSTGKWYAKSTSALSIHVEEGASAEGSGDELVFNSELQKYGKGDKTSGFYISSPVYWLVYIIPLIALLIVILYYRKRLALLANGELMRRKQAGSMARKRLRAAASAMKSGKADLFYDELLRAVWGYLSDKLTVPTSELSRDNITDKLLSIGVDRQLADDAIALIDDCEFAKYGSYTGADLQSTYNRAAKLIDSIEESVNKQVSINKHSIDQ